MAFHVGEPTLLPFALHEGSVRGGHARGSKGGTRRETRSTAASTDGTGRNAPAGIRRPISKDHQGAHTVESIVLGGVAERFRATANWTTKSARTSELDGSSSRCRRMEVVAPNGSDPKARKGWRGIR
jgi:hypothetical protein